MRADALDASTCTYFKCMVVQMNYTPVRCITLMHVQMNFTDVSVDALHLRV